jgi:hypothetical protein
MKKQSNHSNLYFDLPKPKIPFRAREIDEVYKIQKMNPSSNTNVLQEEVKTKDKENIDFKCDKKLFTSKPELPLQKPPQIPLSTCSIDQRFNNNHPSKLTQIPTFKHLRPCNPSSNPPKPSPTPKTLKISFKSKIPRILRS